MSPWNAGEPPRPGPDARLRASGRDGAAGAALGQNADFASPPPPALQVETVKNPPPVRAWYLRSHARQVLKRAGVQKRLRFCGAKISRGASGVGVWSRPDKSYGRFSGVCVCGQSLVCPVCAPRIAAFRAEDVKTGFRSARQNGYETRLVTYTMPHHLGERLGDLIDEMSDAWRRFNSGKAAHKRRHDSLGNITAFEFTFGAHGWHPHKHQLRFDKPGTFCEHKHRAGWASALESVGRCGPGVLEHAFDAGLVGDEAGAEYISKLTLAVDAQARAVSNEVALGSAKGKGRNIMALLAAAAQGDIQSETIWFMGACEIISRKVTSLRWSRGLRDLLGVGPEKSDEEVAQEEVMATDLYLGTLQPWQWRVVVDHNAGLPLLCAANQGADQVNAVLAGLGAGFLGDEDPLAVATDGAVDQALTRAVLQDKRGAFYQSDLVGAQINREIERPSALSRQQIEEMKG